MSSTLGDLLREVAEPGPNRNSFHSTAHFPSGMARTRARRRMEDKIRSRILPNVNSAAIGALSRRAGPQKRDHGAGGPEISVAALAVARLERYVMVPASPR